VIISEKRECEPSRWAQFEVSWPEGLVGYSLKLFALTGGARIEPHADRAEQQETHGEGAGATVIRRIFVKGKKDLGGVNVDARRDADQRRRLEGLQRAHKQNQQH